MAFLDLIKNAIFEEEAQPKPTAASAPRSTGTPRPAPPPSSPPVAASFASSPAASDNQFYSRLVKQTDLAAVPELAKIEAFAAPLASVITDKSIRYKAALATAQSQSGLTKDDILKGFDALQNVLNSSANTFNKQTDEVSRTEVDAKIAKINDVNDAIQHKQKEIS